MHAISIAASNATMQFLKPIVKPIKRGFTTMNQRELSFLTA